MKNNKLKIVTIIAAASVALLTGCSTLQDSLIETQSGELTPNPEMIESVELIGNAAQTLGVPYAGLAGQLLALVSTGAALLINERRRKEKQVADTLIQAVESEGNRSLKQTIEKQAIRAGVEPVLHQKVKALKKPS